MFHLNTNRDIITSKYCVSFRFDCAICLQKVCAMVTMKHHFLDQVTSLDLKLRDCKLFHISFSMHVIIKIYFCPMHYQSITSAICLMIKANGFERICNHFLYISFSDIISFNVFF